MMQPLLPLPASRAFAARVVNSDDVGRLIDRARILLDNAISALADAEHVVPEVGPIADELDRLRDRVVQAWHQLDEPSLPF
jgi:hypothetical protein